MIKNKHKQDNVRSFERELQLRPYMRVGVFWRVLSARARSAAVRSPATILQLHTELHDVETSRPDAFTNDRIGNKND